MVLEREREKKKKPTASANTEDCKDPSRRLFFSLSLCGWFYLNRWVDLWEQTCPTISLHYWHLSSSILKYLTFKYNLMGLEIVSNLP